MAGPGADVVLMGNGLYGPPAGWNLVLEGPGIQMVCERLEPSDSTPDAVTPTLESPGTRRRRRHAGAGGSREARPVP